MRAKLPAIFIAFLTVLLLAACGEDASLSQFRKKMDAFCTRISEIDSSINSIDVQSDGAVSKLLACLGDLDEAFRSFAQFDFPEEFSYLEGLAAESSEYMTEAVKSYRDAYGGEFDEGAAEYALQNYSRAYKRLQIIISFLHGETPSDTDLILHTD